MNNARSGLLFDGKSLKMRLTFISLNYWRLSLGMKKDSEKSPAMEVSPCKSLLRKVTYAKFDVYNSSATMERGHYP